MPKVPSRVYDDPRYRAACRILRQRDRICHRCGYDIDVTLHWRHPLSWTANHIIPKSLLNREDPRNWQITNLEAMHRHCNLSLGNRTPTRRVGLNTSQQW